MAHIKAIIFDTDGMMIRNDVFSKRYSAQFGIPIEKILAYIKNEHQLCLVGKASFRDALEKYKDDWEWKGTIEELMVYWFDGESDVDGRLVEIIKKLREKNILCVLATNQVQERTDYLVTKLGFDKIFDKIYSSSTVGFKKPQPEFFEYILKDLKLKPEEVMFWDDDEKNIAGAKACRIPSNLYTTLENFKAALLV